MPKFPHYKQLDSMDCGTSYLHMVAKYYGRSYRLQYLSSQSYNLRRCGISEAVVKTITRC